VSEKDLSRVVVDTTVQEKNITFPTDAKLLSRAVIKLAKFALSHGIKLRQSYSRKAKKHNRLASGYAAAQQFGRLKKCNQDLKYWAGRVLRDIERKGKNIELSPEFLQLIATTKKLLQQERHTPKKVYSLHELEVQCIGKGKVNKRYEFGNKAAIVLTNKKSLIVNVEHLPDSPYDGHTLSRSISGAEVLTGVTVCEANVDRGYRGHDYEGSAVIRLSGSSNRGMSVSECRRKRRRSSIEPVIGHMKSDHRLDRCMLRGSLGDAMNLIGSASGFNMRKILRGLALGMISLALLAWRLLERLLCLPIDAVTPSA